MISSKYKIGVMILLILITASCLLFSQNYQWKHGSFNTSGGFTQTANYSTTISVGEEVVGEVTNTDFISYLGFLYPELDKKPPEITSITDIPLDQGREVRIIWDRCALDKIYDQNNFYSVWRKDDDLILRKKKSEFSSSDNTYSNPIDAIKSYSENPDRKSYWRNNRDIWTFIDTIPAIQELEYSIIAETLMDSCSADTAFTTYKVLFHDIVQYFESRPDSGYSVDNIAPDRVENITIAVNSNSRNQVINITWDEVNTGTLFGNTYPEINNIIYRIYSGDNPDFECDEAHYLDYSTNNSYEYSFSDERVFFKIKACDEPIE